MQLAYWRSALGGAPAALELASDRARPSVQSFRGGSVALSVGGDAWQAAVSVAASVHATPVAALLAAWGGVLGQSARQRCVVVGVPTAGARDEAAFGRTVGYFVSVVGVLLWKEEFI